MRRLPVYFLLDISESMVGEPILQVEEGLGTVVRTLKTDPYALETVHLSVIAFAGKPLQLTPLTDIIAFYPPKIPIGGGTALGKALDYLMDSFDRDLMKTTSNQKGDWKPIVFLFTDGAPTDNTGRAIERWNANYRRKATIVAVSFGTTQNHGLLKQISENVLTFDNSNSEAYKQFFRWITASIQASSASLQTAMADNIELADIDKTRFNLSKTEAVANSTAPQTDDNFAVFTARCQTKNHPYLIKYRKAPVVRNYFGEPVELMGYKLEGAYQVAESYFDLTDLSYVPSTVATNELAGVPSCPVCGNQHGFCVCSCGKVFCVGQMGFNKCPWCNQFGDFGAGEGHLDINRSQG